MKNTLLHIGIGSLLALICIPAGNTYGSFIALAGILGWESCQWYSHFRTAFRALLGDKWKIIKLTIQANWQNSVYDIVMSVFGLIAGCGLLTWVGLI